MSPLSHFLLHLWKVLYILPRHLPRHYLRSSFLKANSPTNNPKNPQLPFSLFLHYIEIQGIQKEAHLSITISLKMESQGCLCLLWALLACYLFSSSVAYNSFDVGGKDGWVINPSESYNHWAERNRFQVNDSLGKSSCFGN